MKVLVTGSDGYIGTVLTEVLKKEGFEVTGLDTGYYREGWLYDNGIKKLPNVISKDTRNIHKSDLSDYNAVVHLAELSNDPLGQNDPELTYEINHRATIRLAQTAKANGIKRFIYFSSCSVYGASDGIADEKSKPNPLTAYAKCKILNETALSKLSDKNFSPTFLRNATAFGASPRMRFDLVVNDLAGMAWTKKTLKLESDGTPWRPFVHLRDICQAVVCTLKAPIETVHNQIFNVGDTKSNYQIKDIASEINKVFSGCKITLGDSSGDNRDYRVNFNKINSKLPDFNCEYSVRDGIYELYNIFKEINLDENTFKAPPYTRLKQINKLRQSGRLDKKLFWRKNDIS